MEKKVNSQQHIGMISRGICAFAMMGALIAFNMLTTGCGGKKNLQPTPFPLPTEGPPSYDFSQLPPGVRANLSRLQGANPRFSQVAGPLMVGGKAHYYQVVRYNVAENKAAPGGEYSGPRPNWADATTLAMNSKHTVGGVELRGHAAAITSAEERSFILTNFGSIPMDKTDLTNGKNTEGGVINPIRGIALGATLKLLSTNPTVKRIDWVTGETSTYENWTRSRSNVRIEPGADGDKEPYLQINFNAGSDYLNSDGWNDYNGDPNLPPSASPDAYQTTGYLVEFE
jgi:hypothetical protein